MLEMSPAQKRVEEVFSQFLERRDEDTVKEMMQAFMDLTIREIMEHKGANAGMIEDIFDEMRLQGKQSVAEAEGQMRGLLDLALHNPNVHTRLEYCLNRWLYTRDEQYAVEIREISKTNELVSKFLKSGIETRALLEAV